MLDRSVLHPLSPQGLALSNLIVFIFAIALVIFLIPTSVLIYTAIRFRYRAGENEEPPQIYGQTLLESAWTITPFVILVAVFVVTIGALRAASPPDDALAQGTRPDLTVVGHQWWWELHYKDGAAAVNEIHLPVGTRMLVALQSADVMHALWVPQINGQMDAVPGQTNLLYLQSDRVGTYAGQCAQFCGTAHGLMLLRVIVQTRAAFDAWEKSQMRGATTSTSASSSSTVSMTLGGNSLRGAHDFLQLTCQSCHQIDGTAAHGQIGPNLTHVGGRQTIAAGALTNTPLHLEAWLRDPQAVKPGNHMPNLLLNDEQIHDLSAYLEGLK